MQQSLMGRSDYVCVPERRCQFTAASITPHCCDVIQDEKLLLLVHKLLRKAGGWECSIHSAPCLSGGCCHQSSLESETWGNIPLKQRRLEPDDSVLTVSVCTKHTTISTVIMCFVPEVTSAHYKLLPTSFKLPKKTKGKSLSEEARVQQLCQYMEDKNSCWSCFHVWFYTGWVTSRQFIH